MSEVFAALPIPEAVIKVNNRKLAEGFFRGAGATDPDAALRALDKLDKVGRERVAASACGGGRPECRWGRALCLQLADDHRDRRHGR